MTRCLACGSLDVRVFYEQAGVPVHSVLLCATREQAVDFPRGEIRLGFCAECGFIGNLSFREELLRYSQDYEETQSFSPTFRAFHESLTRSFLDRHGLHRKKIVEIGCGKGDFLHLICQMGDNEGLGFDPAYIPERDAEAGKDKARFVQDFFSEELCDSDVDAFCCKMTLEHITRPAELLATLRGCIERSDGARPEEALLFFQVPDVTRILRDVAYWDIYYEHCSYFSAASLRNLFVRAGFEPLRVASEYDAQYLTLEARPLGSAGVEGISAAELDGLARDVDSFAREFEARRTWWRDELERRASRGAVLWGGGSKAVAFVTALGDTARQVDYVVDINPHKQGAFLPGSGHAVLNPEQLAENPPGLIVLMNSIYRGEVEAQLEELGVDSELLAL